MIVEFWKGGSTWFIWICFLNGHSSLTFGEKRSEDLYQGLDISLPLFPQQWQPKVKKGCSWSLQQHIVRYHFRLFFPDLEFYISEPNSLRVSFLQGRPFETTETLSFPVYFFSLSSFLNNPMLKGYVYCDNIVSDLKVMLENVYQNFCFEVNSTNHGRLAEVEISNAVGLV